MFSKKKAIKLSWVKSRFPKKLMANFKHSVKAVAKCCKVAHNLHICTCCLVHYIQQCLGVG